MKYIPESETINNQKIRSYDDIILISIITILTIISFFTNHALNTVHTIILIIFGAILPGYLISLILYPVRDDLERNIRLGLSFAINFPMTSIMGYILYYTKFGLDTNSILFPLSILTLILIVIAFFKRINIPKKIDY